MSIVNFHFRSADNIGDMVSAPALYFDRDISVHEITEREQSQAAAGVILGGGAILPKCIRRRLQFPAPTVIWGAGFTAPQQGFVDYVLPDYDLIGVRDYPSRYRWVPCASCLSPLFDRAYPVTREYVVYENPHLRPLPQADADNTGFGRSLEEVIALLASAETVVTSSYHGAYWATLLGRRVAVVPTGSKFFGFRHPPVYVAGWDRGRKVKGLVYPEALEECRQANYEFAEAAWDILG